MCRECTRKDQIIADLRDELAAYKAAVDKEDETDRRVQAIASYFNISPHRAVIVERICRGQVYVSRGDLVSVMTDSRYGKIGKRKDAEYLDYRALHSVLPHLRRLLPDGAIIVRKNVGYRPSPTFFQLVKTVTEKPNETS